MYHYQQNRQTAQIHIAVLSRSFPTIVISNKIFSKQVYLYVDVMVKCERWYAILMRLI
jgi:hypothetical protein